MHVPGHVGHVVVGILACTPPHAGSPLAWLGRGLCMPHPVQRAGRVVAGILYHVARWRLDGLCRQYHRRPAGHAGLPPVASTAGQVCTTPQVLMPSQEPLRPLVPVLCRGLFILWILYLFYRYSTTELSFTPFEPFIRMVFPEGWSALSFSMRACTSG